MYQESLQYLLLLEQEVQELTTLVDRVQVLHPHLDLSCQPLVAMVPTRAYQHAGGIGGLGSGGDVNMYGGGGSAHGRINGAGGYSFFGGCAARGHPRGGDYSRNHQSDVVHQVQVELTDGLVLPRTRRYVWYLCNLGV